jgi:deazaflavin-dependent oxidoreductase (nitroreductase family)
MGGPECGSPGDMVRHGDPGRTRGEGMHRCGRVGARFGRLEQILLTTTGRRSGLARTTPLAGIPHGDRLVLVASNWGQEHHPNWFHNLLADPDVVVRRGPREVRMRARVASQTERATLWPVVVEVNPGFEAYARRASRQIPLVICEPAD